MSDAELRSGLVFAEARLSSVAAHDGALHVVFELPSGKEITFALDTSGPKGPFPTCPELSYRSTSVPYSEIAPVGRALADFIVGAARNLPVRELVARWLTEASSLDAPFDALVGHPERSLTVADHVAPELADARPCTLPWTRLELGFGASVGPCCADFQAAPQTASGSFAELWHAPHMRAFRRALSAGGPPRTCSPSCPRLRGRSDSLAQLVLRGGPAPFVENQRHALNAILAGSELPAGTPLELVISTTSHCNYDCLMCHFGAEGSLADELPQSFYDSLTELLPGLARLEALGGEPLSSPVFREFLASGALPAHAKVALTTNGSYLTPKELERLSGVSFEHVTVSLNAASAETYARVNRGLPMTRIRENLAALRERVEAVTYSMVLLRENLTEIEAFAALAERDGVGVRFMLPMHDRNGQSIMTDAEIMRDVERRLRLVAKRLGARDAARALGEAEVLSDRLARGVIRALPDDLVELRRPSAV